MCSLLSSLLRQADDLFQELGGQVSSSLKTDYVVVNTCWWWSEAVDNVRDSEMGFLPPTSENKECSGEYLVMKVWVCRHCDRFWDGPPSPRWQTSRPGLARCRGGWSTCRRRFRSTTPRRRNYVSSPIIWTSRFKKNCTFRPPTSLTSLPIIQQLMVIYVGIVTGQ